MSGPPSFLRDFVRDKQDDIQNAFRVALSARNFGRAAELLDAGADINYVYREATAVEMAGANHQPDVVRWLLARGATMRGAKL